NRNISCGTCHHPRFGTADGVSVSLGEGGLGLGPERRVDPDNPPEQHIPRNAPALFNLGAHEVTVLFHDGRIEVDPSRPSGLRTPMGTEMEAGFATLLSAQTMFPVLSADEMAGHYSENEISQAVRMGRITGEGGAWDLLSQRVAEIPDYAQAFEALDPGAPITFTAISDAIAAFMEVEWRSDTSPFDAFLRGEAPLPVLAEVGLQLFYGEAGCADCHSGALLTDHGFHAMGTPQIGPGKGARFEQGQRDEGRIRVTGHAEDRYRFRTPSLRNVAATGPYGHAGAHRTLAGFVAYHAAPNVNAYRFDGVLPQADMPKDPRAPLQDQAEMAQIQDAVSTPKRDLAPDQVEALVAFLNTLTDAVALEGRWGIPERVPSGLPIDR
ncbi:MAG: cytochrome c peroxidase, partial [Pseudomonadota bacterium]